jgi:hypothetical protein
VHGPKKLERIRQMLDDVTTDERVGLDRLGRAAEKAIPMIDGRRSTIAFRNAPSPQPTSTTWAFDDTASATTSLRRSRCARNAGESGIALS